MNDRIRRAVQIAEDRGMDIQTYFGYAEPGYDDPKSGVVATANWNNVSRYDPETRETTVTDTTPERVAAILEKLGVECEWSDEWTRCDECYKAVRIEPNGYWWKPAYKQYKDGTTLCSKCAASETKELEEEVA